MQALGDQARPRRPGLGHMGRPIKIKANHFKVACALTRVGICATSQPLLSACLCRRVAHHMYCNWDLFLSRDWLRLDGGMQAFHYDVVISPAHRQSDQSGEASSEQGPPRSSRPERPLDPEVNRCFSLCACTVSMRLSSCNVHVMVAIHYALDLRMPSCSATGWMAGMR